MLVKQIGFELFEPWVYIKYRLW